MEKNIKAKINRTVKKIIKRREKNKDSEEEREIEDIHRILNSLDDKLSENPTTDLSSKEREVDSSCGGTIPTSPPEVNVFNDELTFTLFSQENCRLECFIDNEEKSLILSENNSLLSEECFRKLLAYHVAETLLPDDGKFDSLCLYVFYLMSVHREPDFVKACFDFLRDHTFPLHPQDIFPIFVNFGAKKEYFEFCEVTFLKRFHKEDGIGAEGSSRGQFPYLNMEMVGQTLLHYVAENSVVASPEIKSLIKGLVKITLDSRIRSGFLLPLFSTILTALCRKFQPEDILPCIHSKEEHLLNQLEICRIISKLIFPALHETLVVATISDIIKSETLPTQTPIEIDYLKSVLKELRTRELSPLEIYSVLQLINVSLPGVTATVKDSTEICIILASLDVEVNRVENSLDLITIRIEIAKAQNLVANNKDHRFPASRKLKRSQPKKIKCSK